MASFTSLDEIILSWPSVLTRNPALSSWTMKLVNSRIVFHSVAAEIAFGQYATKTVQILQDLSWCVRVAAFVAQPNDLSFHNVPPVLGEMNDIVHLLYNTLNGVFCCGCRNPEYKQLKPIVYDKTGTIVGKADNGLSKEEVIFRSTNCTGILSLQSGMQVCKSCQLLDPILRVQLTRCKSLVNSDRFCEIMKNRSTSQSSTNWRYLDLQQACIRASDEQRRRVNSEKREKYAKRKLLEEKNTKKLSKDWDEDLTSIFESVNKETKPAFPNNPDMEFFWQLQRDMVDKKNRRWHPRQALFTNSQLDKFLLLNIYFSQFGLNKSLLFDSDCIPKSFQAAEKVKL